MSEVRLLEDPPAEMVRVHWQPDLLRRPPLDSDPAAASRFDDPRGEYAVRYTATALRGCLVETMSRFRPAPHAEAVLSLIVGVDEHDVDPSRDDGLLAWLAVQQVGTCAIDQQQPQLVDVDAADSLIHLDKHHDIRAALDASPLGTATNPARLDGGVIRLAGPVARPITQAVSRAVWDWHPDVVGLAYRSRLDETEQCWALYERCPITWTSIEPLSPDNAEHLAAVRAAAALYEILLPPPWA